MTTALDTNVIVALWDRDESLSSAAEAALKAASRRGPLVISGPVFAELTAAPGRDESFVDAFLRDTGVSVEWTVEERVWRLAARAFRDYAGRRRKQRETGPRRILADFLIGAHALARGYRLLTLDDRLYRGAFTALAVTSI